MPLPKQLMNAERDPLVPLMALATKSGLGRFLDSPILIKERDIYECVLPHDDIMEPDIFLFAIICDNFQLINNVAEKYIFKKRKLFCTGSGK